MQLTAQELRKITDEKLRTNIDPKMAGILQECKVEAEKGKSYLSLKQQRFNMVEADFLERLGFVLEENFSSNGEVSSITVSW